MKRSGPNPSYQIQTRLPANPVSPSRLHGAGPAPEAAHGAVERARPQLLALAGRARGAAGHGHDDAPLPGGAALEARAREAVPLALGGARTGEAAAGRAGAGAGGPGASRPGGRCRR